MELEAKGTVGKTTCTRNESLIGKSLQVILQLQVLAAGIGRVETIQMTWWLLPMRVIVWSTMFGRNELLIKRDWLPINVALIARSLSASAK